MVENLDTGSVTVSPGELVLATVAQQSALAATSAGVADADPARADTSGNLVCGDNVLPVAPQREEPPASVTQTIVNSPTSDTGFVAPSTLSPSGTLRSNVGQPLQPGTQESTPSSLAYSEWSAASSSSNELTGQLQGLRFVEDPTALGSGSMRHLLVSQGSAFAPVNRAAIALPSGRVVPRNNAAGVQGVSRSGSALQDAARRATALASQSRVVTWHNLFDDVPEATAVATRSFGQEPVTLPSNPPAVDLTHGGIVPAAAAAAPAAVVASTSAGSGVMEQEDVARLPLMPLLLDSDRAARPLPMLQRRPAPDEDDATDFLSLREMHWPSLPVPPAVLGRSKSGASSSSTDSNE